MGRASRTPCFVTVASAALVLSASARADPPPSDTPPSELARKLDAEGRALFVRESYAEAARAFEQAFEQAPRATTKYNVALSWDQAGDAARAADAFEAALALPGLDPERSRGSERRLSELRLRLGYVVARRPLGAFVSVLHVSERPLPTQFHVPPGAHLARVKLPDGRIVDVPVEVRAGQTVELTVDAPQRVLTLPVEAPRQRDTQPAPAPDAPSAAGGLAPWPWVALGGAAVFSGAAIGLGVRTLDERDTYVAEHHDDESARDHVVTLRNWTNAAWGAAIVCAGVSAALFIVDHTSRTRPTTAAHRSPWAIRF